MLDERKLSLLLFASLGLNIFLGGVLGGKLLSERQESASTTTSPSQVRSNSPQKRKEGGTPKLGKLRHSHQDRTKSHRPQDLDAHRRGGPRDHKAEGPSDLFLLRQMIRIMGGPKDPRISNLHEERRDEIHRIRSEMQAAHRRVHEALTAEEPDEQELQASLKNLRKTAFESQARAQEGILTLAKLMTPEERAKLRALRIGKKPGNPRRPEGRPSLKKPAPVEDKGRPSAAP